jgi:hypothetical protein
MMATINECEQLTDRNHSANCNSPLFRLLADEVTAKSANKIKPWRRWFFEQLQPFIGGLSNQLYLHQHTSIAIHRPVVQPDHGKFGCQTFPATQLFGRDDGVTFTFA